MNPITRILRLALVCTVAFITLPAVRAISFQPGDLPGWNKLGDVSVVDETYGVAAIDGYSALLTTGPGARPFSEILAFLVTNGMPTHAAALAPLNSPGAVGSILLLAVPVVYSIDFPMTRLSTSQTEQPGDSAFLLTPTGYASFNGAPFTSASPFPYESATITYNFPYRPGFLLWENSDAGSAGLLVHQSQSVPDGGMTALLGAGAMGLLVLGRHRDALRSNH